MSDPATVIRQRILVAGSLALAVLVPGVALACTSLAVTDTRGEVYFGRTMEMALDFPYQVTSFPAGRQITSALPNNQPGLRYRTKHRMVAVTVPLASPADLKIVEGMNDAGLTFSMLAFPAVGPEGDPEGTRKALAAVDLGTWALGQFRTTAEVKAALRRQPVILTALSVMGNAKTPFHYVLHDRSGAGIVIEYVAGKQVIHDNPVNVMTNGPSFSWHLTNLTNYSFLTNVDQSKGIFGSLTVIAPDSGVATSGLPSANTSVGRFVRAAYYSTYAKRGETPDDAVRILAHVMNNFDRPVNITIDPASSPVNSEGAVGAILATKKASPAFLSESTKWTTLSDLNRGRFYIRPQNAMNYTMVDLGKLARFSSVRSFPLDRLNGTAADGDG
ncbi:MAG: linear amide C-N hydrolase, partial [Cyanobacteriota bacterium]|nr:linear amide C-N hydrolase [Cyanobacteriota bacterium]